MIPVLPPIDIEGLPVVRLRAISAKGKSSETWSFFPTEEEADKGGLRIEFCVKPDGSSEVRLVKGSWLFPKHLEVIRLRELNLVALRRAVARLKKSFDQKGW